MSTRTTRLCIGAAIATVVLALIAGACGASADSAADSAASRVDLAVDAAQASVDDAAGFDTEMELETEAAMSDEIAEAEAAALETTDAAGATDAERAVSDGGDAATSTGSAGAPAGQIPDTGRDIIYTAWLELGANDVSAATRQAVAAVEGFGGYPFSQQTEGGRGAQSLLVFKILPEQFHRALSELGSVGDVKAQSINAEDVTGAVVDLQSRITTAEASVVRLRALLDEADNIEIIASLEFQLLDRETTLERLRGQLRSLRSQVDLATITVRITEVLNRPELSLHVSTYGLHDGGFNCIEPGRVGHVQVGDPVTICYVIANEGDTELIDLAIDDPEVAAAIGDLLVVEGSTATLAPGEVVVLAHELDAEESLRSHATVTAVGVDPDGNALTDEVAATGNRLRITVAEPDGLPGFGETLSNSWGALKNVVTLVALAVVAVLPFLILAVIVGPVIWWLLRRRRGGEGGAEPALGRDPEPTPDEV